MEVRSPSYCPRIRDGIYRRTLFLARDHSAIISHSVGDHTERAVNLLLDDVPAVRTLEGQFNNFLALCKPLMDVYRSGDAGELRHQLDCFHSDAGELLSGTLPESVTLLAREGVGAFIFSPASDGPVFHITEVQLVTAICEYLRRLDHRE